MAEQTAKPKPEDTPEAEAKTTLDTSDPRVMVQVYDSRVKTENRVARRVPATWLDGRFPHLKQVPTDKKAGN